jgi:hypothetical protein
MLLPQELIENKVQSIPPFELSYENSTSHKKVPDNYHITVAIPRSKKYIAWFTFIQEHDVCILLELNREKKIVACKQINVVFDVAMPHLALGTILFGSYIQDVTENPHLSAFFVVEDILMYRGVSVRKLTFGDRLGILHHILVRDRTILPASGRVVFQLPQILPADTPVPLDGRDVFYKIHHYQYRSLTHVIPYLNIPIQSNNSWSNPLEIVDRKSMQLGVQPEKRKYKEPFHNQKYQFWVTADLQSDIYHLHDPQNLYMVDFAYIPNYRISVFMNNLFRNIKENQNIDAIEESDDEDDFYDTRFDKYVIANKRCFMECVYNKKFKRWMPLRLIS